MPSFIGSFEHAGVRYFLTHSTVVDAPTSCATTEKEFTAYYLNYSALKVDAALAELRLRLERAKASGSSSVHTETFDCLVWWNRAGHQESRLTVDQYKALVLAARAEYGLPAALAVVGEE